MTTLECRQILRRGLFSRLARMPRARLSLPALALGATAALSLVACGGEDAKLLPGETAREITANLDTVRQLSDEGDCLGAESAARQVGEQIEALEGVDRKLKRALEDGALRLEEVIASCEEPPVEAIAPATIPSESEEEEKAPKEKKENPKEPQPKEEEMAPETSPSHPLPPQANGEGKGLENGNGPPPSEEGNEESPSGGVGPGSPAEGGD
jgi:ribosomal protein L12E/L44/L45/RPP1/RPP2